MVRIEGFDGERFGQKELVADGRETSRHLYILEGQFQCDECRMLSVSTSDRCLGCIFTIFQV